MKKLLVIALSVVMVLAFAAVSMAAAFTVTGEADFDYNTLPSGDTTVDNYFEFNGHLAINDNVSVQGGFKVDSDATSTLPIEARPTYVTIKTGDASTLTFFNDTWNMGGDMDYLTKGVADISSAFGIKYDTTLAEGLTATVAVFPNVDNKKDVNGEYVMGYGLGLAYAKDALGLSFGYSKSELDNAGYVLNADYKLGDFKPFVQYGVGQYTGTALDDNTKTFIGALYQQADGPFGARLEYGLTEDPATSKTPMAIYLDYKVNGVLFRVIDANVAGDTTTTLKVQVVF